jgi:hypothetical protein
VILGSRSTAAGRIGGIAVGMGGGVEAGGGTSVEGGRTRVGDGERVDVIVASSCRVGMDGRLGDDIVDEEVSGEVSGLAAQAEAIRLRAMAMPSGKQMTLIVLFSRAVHSPAQP